MATQEDDLADVPIHNAEVGASVPSVEEARVDSSKNRPTSRCHKWGVLAAVVTVIAVVILGVSLGVRNSNSKQESGSPPNDEEKSPQDVGPALEDIIDYLVKSGVSSRSDLEDESSPQNMAAAWMAKNDSLYLSVPGEDAKSSSGYRFVSRYVLVLLWHVLDGKRWTNQFGFLKARDECLWNDPLKVRLPNGDEEVAPGGVYCDGEGNLDSIHLDSNNLRGTLPAELGFLTTAKTFGFNTNIVTGSFPSEFCKLTGLRSLGLSHNDLSLEIPSCVSKLSDLRVLMLSDNALRGKLPDLSGFTEMVTLLLDDNDLTGDISTMLAGMTRLKYLYIEDNDFGLELDANFLNSSTELLEVDISNCGFSGPAPWHLLDLSSLRLLDMNGNSFTEQIPSDIPVNSALKMLSFHKNQIGGALPASISNLKSLRHLDASSNLLSGPMTSELGQLTDLRYLFLAENDWDEGPIPDTFSALSSLEELSLKSTNRNGTIPAFLGLFSNIVLLDLASNSLQGNIPSSWGDLLKKLQFLLLNQNQDIIGAVPPSFSNLIDLRAVFLDETGISGSLQPFCVLPGFMPSASKNKKDMLIADCKNNPNLTCDCCDICCDPSTNEGTCNPNNAIASLSLEWESSFARDDYEFGPDLVYEDRQNIPL